MSQYNISATINDGIISLISSDGAVNIPIAQLRNRINEVPRDKKVILFCNTGYTSYNASRILIQNGFNNVYSLCGGISLYKELVKDKKGILTMPQRVATLVLSTLFASMQVSYAAGLSDAAINKIEGGYAGQVAGNGSLDLNFNGNAHVNWDHLNVNKGESLNFNAVGGANGLRLV